MHVLQVRRQRRRGTEIEDKESTCTPFFCQRQSFAFAYPEGVRRRLPQRGKEDAQAITPYPFAFGDARTPSPEAITPYPKGVKGYRGTGAQGYRGTSMLTPFAFTKGDRITYGNFTPSPLATHVPLRQRRSPRTPKE